ncbi:MAG: hypothetical protein LBU62_04280 [Bacteroidales bacterium]|jgi:hypothetical protein|nr:hypothetical protein [Bacteroidales bacterium]
MNKLHILIFFSMLSVLASAQQVDTTDDEITIQTGESDEKPVRKGQSAHEFSLTGAVGLSALQYSTDAGKQSNGFGGAAGFGYAFYCYNHWAVVMGVDIAQMTAQTDGITLADKYRVVDGNGAAFDFQSRVVADKELQSLLMLRIPLMLQYTTGGNTGWYMAVGTKVCFPLVSEYTLHYAEITASGNFAGDAEQNFAGKSSGKLYFKPVVLAALETGVKFKLTPDMFIYVGVFVDYGVDNMLHTGNDGRIIDYNTLQTGKWTANSILNSRTEQGYITEKLNLFSAGIQLKIAFGKGKVTGGNRWKPGKWKPARR